MAHLLVGFGNLFDLALLYTAGQPRYVLELVVRSLYKIQARDIGAAPRTVYL